MSIRVNGWQFLAFVAVGIVLGAVTLAAVTAVVVVSCDGRAKLDATMPSPVLLTGDVEYLYVRKDGKIIDRYRLK